MDCRRSLLKFNRIKKKKKKKKKKKILQARLNRNKIVSTFSCGFNVDLIFLHNKIFQFQSYLMRWSLYKYKCLQVVGGKSRDSSIQEGVSIYIHLEQAKVEFLYCIYKKKKKLKKKVTVKIKDFDIQINSLFQVDPPTVCLLNNHCVKCTNNI